MNVYLDISDILLGIPSIRKFDSVALYKPRIGNTIRKYTKMEDLINFRVVENYKILESTQLEAGLIVFRNDQFSSLFFRSWYTYMVNSFSNIIKSEIQFGEFIADRQDQAVLSLMTLTDFKNHSNVITQDFSLIHRGNLLEHMDFNEIN